MPTELRTEPHDDLTEGCSRRRSGPDRRPRASPAVRDLALDATTIPAQLSRDLAEAGSPRRIWGPMIPLATIRMPGTSKPSTAFPLVGGRSSVSTQSAPEAIRTLTF